MGKETSQRETGAEQAISNIVQNRKARHDYEILDSYEAGIVLVGTEVKSLRAGKVNLKDSYASIEKGEVILRSVHISHTNLAIGSITSQSDRGSFCCIGPRFGV